MSLGSARAVNDEDVIFATLAAAAWVSLETLSRLRFRLMELEGFEEVEVFASEDRFLGAGRLLKSPNFTLPLLSDAFVSVFAIEPLSDDCRRALPRSTDSGGHPASRGAGL